MTESTAFKHWIDRAAVERLADALARTGPLDRNAFVEAAAGSLEPLELKDRVRHVTRTLRAHLEPDYEQALAHVLRALPPGLDGTDEVTSAFALWPYATFVEEYGRDHFDASMQAMVEITQRFSAEFAVRPFLDAEPERTFAFLAGLTAHPSAHVRRWVSEGTRPRLPWGLRLKKLVADPSPSLPLLEALRADSEEYVRRSVANHLNDIAKDHPALVVKTCARWWKDADADGRRMIKHALRTLVKRGDPKALAVLGFGPPRVLVERWTTTERVTLGGDPLELSLEVRSTATGPQRLLVDFVIHHQKANGTTSPKVFKWTERTLAPGETLTLHKRHAMRPITTRRYHAGEHFAEVLLNGETKGRARFELSL